MYFSVAGQVHVPSWSKGRIGLLGDCAFCNATFGGAGTNLALIGAYILAGELAATADHAAALVSYQHRMQPFTASAPSSVRQCCGLPTRAPGLASRRCAVSPVPPRVPPPRP